MLMPRSFYPTPTVLNDRDDPALRPGVEAMIVRIDHLGIKPRLGVDLLLVDVDMERLARVAFVGIEVEPEAAFAKDDRHPIRAYASAMSGASSAFMPITL